MGGVSASCSGDGTLSALSIMELLLASKTKKTQFVDVNVVDVHRIYQIRRLRCIYEYNGFVVSKPWTFIVSAEYD